MQTAFNKFYGLFAVSLISQVSYASPLTSPIEIDCTGPEGTFTLQVDPSHQTTHFVLNQNGKLIQGQTDPVSNQTYKSGFQASLAPFGTQGTNWISIKSVIQKNTFVPTHDICLPTRVIDRCFSQTIQAHNEWQDVYGIDSDFEILANGSPNGSVDAQFIFLKGTQANGVLPIGHPNHCVVKGL